MNLRPHQETAREWLANRARAYLADEPRVGKTPTVIMAARDVGVQRTLVLCPAVVVGNWRHEWARWGGPGTLRVLSYDMATRLAKTGGLAQLDEHGPDLVVLDEAHYCKSLTAQRTKVALKLARNAPRAWLLSGTPMPNHPGELFAPLAALWPEEMRAIGATSYLKWLGMTCRYTMTDYGPKVWKVEPSREAAALMQRLMLRRTFEQVSGTTPLWWSEQYIEPTVFEAQDVLQAIEEAGLDPADVLAGLREEELPLAGPLATVRRLIGTIKAVPAAKLLREELIESPGRKMFVVAYHMDVLDRLQRTLDGMNPLRLDGNVPREQRDAIIAAFQQNPAHRVMLGQVNAAGTGISLAAADEVVFVEQSWTPGDNVQAAMRASLTTKGTVPVRVLSLAGTIDEAVNAVLVRKQEGQTAMGL